MAIRTLKLTGKNLTLEQHGNRKRKVKTHAEMDGDPDKGERCKIYL